MMKLIALMLLGLASLVEGEVVKSFAVSCPQFFIKDQNNKPVTPTVLVSQKRDHKGNPIAQYRQICQRYKNIYRYATLYDTHNRIPVYSAYLYTGYESVDRKAWRVEPGLDGHSETEMTTEAKAGGPVGEHQAKNEDYKDSGYQKGHLYPVCHNCDQDQAESTFTLTNAAPQDEEDNKDWYGQVEKVIGNEISNWCQGGSARVVTGVIPGDGPNLRKRVNVPGYFWSAFCCTHREKKTEYSRGFLAPTKTGMRELHSDPKHDWKLVTWYMSVQELNRHLTVFYNADPPFKVFGNLCLG